MGDVCDIAFPGSIESMLREKRLLHGSLCGLRAGPLRGLLEVYCAVKCIGHSLTTVLSLKEGKNRKSPVFPFLPIW